MAAVAALARIEEVRSQMTTHEATREEAASVARTIWALGDYHRFAKELFWELGPVLAEATGISQGDRVLDVAAGTGNVATPRRRTRCGSRRAGHHAGEPCRRQA